MIFFQLLLSLYPREFRDEYGREMTLLFRDRWRYEAGFWQRLRLILEAIEGAAIGAPQEHVQIFLTDLRYASRSLRNSPLITTAIVVTVAFAAGANATMLSLLDQLLLQPIPGVTEPDRVVRVYGRDYWTAITRSWPDYLDLRDNTNTLSAVAAFQSFDVRTTRIERVTPSYFKLLGVEPLRGRLFSYDPANETVLSYAYWSKEFNLDPKILGRNVRLGDETFTVIGIAPPAFSGVNSTPAALWVPLGDLRRDRGNYGAVHVIARLKPGVPPLAADTDANAANRRGLIADGLKPEADVMQLGALPITQGPKAPKEIKVAIWLASVAGLVLLIGGANIVQLLLAQSLARKNETAIRLALGASPARLLRQWWAETLLLASLGAAASVAVAAIATPAAQALLIPTYKQPILSIRVLLATVIITILSALILATIPAWHKPSPSSSLRSALVTVQIALTIVLLVGASLFVRSLVKVQQIDTGFALNQLVVVNLETPRGVNAASLWPRLAARARELPGVAAAGLTNTVPFESSWRTRFYLAGGNYFNRLSTFLTPEAVTALNLKLLEGRLFSSGDKSVAVVNRQFVRESGTAIGQCLQLMSPTAPCTSIIGIVGDTRIENLFDAAPAQYYLPLANPIRGEEASALLIRTEGSPATAATMIQRELQALLPTQAFAEARPLTTAIEPAIRPWQLAARLFVLFGCLAISIAAVGLFGMLSYLMIQRAHECNIRMSLGARRRDIVLLIGGSTLKLLIPGILLGLVAAFASAQAIRHLLFGVETYDPIAYLIPSAIAIAIATLSGIAPLRNALLQPLLNRAFTNAPNGVSFPSK